MSGKRPAFSPGSAGGVSRADHCETCDTAVRDIAHVLRTLASTTLGAAVDSATLRLWDPYYCQGTVKVHYAKHGFPLCHNRREDFYAVMQRPRADLPKHDVVVTNPPFSGDHIQRALRFCVENGHVPWCMLLPSSVLARPWWEEMSESLQRGGLAAPVVFVAATTTRYAFDKRRPSGGGGGAKKAGGPQRERGAAAVGTPSAAQPPLETIWFVGGLSLSADRALHARFASSLVDDAECVLAASVAELPARIQSAVVAARRDPDTVANQSGKESGGDPGAKRRRM